MSKQLNSYSLEKNVVSSQNAPSSLENIESILGETSVDKQCSLEISSNFDRGILSVNLDVEDLSQELQLITRRTLLVIVADRSGSMSGGPWKQVQDAIQTIIQDSLESGQVKVEVICYNQMAELLPWNSNNFREQISKVNARGMTCFSSAFDAVLNLLNSSLPQEEFSQVIIGFMTDGQHTVKSTNPFESKKKLERQLSELSIRFSNTPIIIHSIGFTSDHQFKFLNDLKSSGTQEGSFQYADQSESGLLMEKIRQLFDLATSSVAEVYLKISIPNIISEEKYSVPILTGGSIELETWIQLPESFKQNFIQKNITTTSTDLESLNHPSSSSSSSSSSSTTTTTQNLTIQEIRAQRKRERKERKKNQEQKNNNKIFFPLNWTIINKKNDSNISGTTEIQFIREDSNLPSWNCKLISEEIDKFSSDFLNKYSNSTLKNILPKDNELISWSEQLNSWQSRLDEIRPEKSNKEERERIQQMKTDVQCRVDSLFSILADLSRSGIVSQTTILGKLNDLRYSTVFKKARRQRTMDQRAQKNSSFLKKVERTLLSLTFPDDDLDLLKNYNISSSSSSSSSSSIDIISSFQPSNIQSQIEISKEFFSCIMSLMDWTELIREERDIIGFGLAIQRSGETVIDEPTNSIKVIEFSSTLLSRKEFNYAMKHSIDLVGHIRSHGGIGYLDVDGSQSTTSSNNRTTATTSSSSALSGRGREPINAWMPMYINEYHWKVVKPLLPSTLAYFCTLDHLGYASSQLPVIFMLLGKMISEIPYDVGEHQLRILFSFARTCYAVSKDFQYFRQQFTGNPEHIDQKEVFHKLIVEFIDSFIDGPESRTKDKIPNILTLVAYFSVVDIDHIHNRNRQKNEFNEFNENQLFWLSLAQEHLRRTTELVFWLEEGQYKSNENIDDDYPLCPSGYLDILLCEEEREEEERGGGELNESKERMNEIYNILYSVDCQHDGRNDGTFRSMLNVTSEQKKLAPLSPVSARAMMQMENTMQTPTTSEGLLKLYTFINVLHQLQSQLPIIEGKSRLDLLWEVLDMNAGIAPESWLTQVKSAFQQLKMKTITPPSTKPSFSLLLQIVSGRSQLHIPRMYRSLLVQAMKTRKNGWAKSSIEKGTYCPCFNDTVNDQKFVFTEAVKDLEFKRVSAIYEREQKREAQIKGERYMTKEEGIHKILNEGPGAKTLPRYFRQRHAYPLIQAFMLSPWGPFGSSHSG